MTRPAPSGPTSRLAVHFEKRTKAIPGGMAFCCAGPKLELHVGRRPRGGAGLEVSVVDMEAKHVRPDAVRELAHEGVVVAQALVIVPAGYADPVFGARQLILQAQELLVGAQLRVVLSE